MILFELSIVVYCCSLVRKYEFYSELHFAALYFCLCLAPFKDLSNGNFLFLLKFFESYENVQCCYTKPSD